LVGGKDGLELVMMEGLLSASTIGVVIGGPACKSLV